MRPHAIAIIGLVAVAGAVALALVVRAGSPPHSSAAVLSSEVMRFAEVSPAPPSPLPSSATSSVPIIVFHIVRPSYPSDSAAVRALAQTPEVFDAELAHLSAAGYHVIPFASLEAHFRRGTALPEKAVILSFDDGWRDQFEYAFPILKKHGMTATFFVFTNGIGRPDFMSWDDLRQLIAAGMTIGDHTRSHPYLTKIHTVAALTDEIAGSKALLEQQLGIRVNDFAYPFGAFNATTTRLVKQAGYASARGDVWTGPQRADRLYDLSAVNAPTTEAAFARMFP